VREVRSQKEEEDEMTQMIWQATHHPPTGEVTPPGNELAPLRGEPIALRRHPDLNRLLTVIQRHEIEEFDAIEAYRGLAYRATDPVMRSLMRMLVEDEEHHHRVLNAIAMELRALASSGGQELHALPGDMGSATLVQLRELAAHEGEGAKDLRALAAQTTPLLGGLLALLLGLIALDGEKHELILRHVLKELESAAEEQSRVS
jgi:hypothetical protein